MSTGHHALTLWLAQLVHEPCLYFHSETDGEKTSCGVGAMAQGREWSQVTEVREQSDFIIAPKDAPCLTVQRRTKAGAAVP